MSGNNESVFDEVSVEELGAGGEVVGTQKIQLLYDPEAAKKKREETQKIEEEARKMAEAKVDAELQPYMAKLLDPAQGYKEKIDAVVALQSHILPGLLKEVAAPWPNMDRVNAASKAITAFRELFKTTQELKALDAAEEINPHNPKFQVVLGWLIELFQQCLVKQDTDPILINNVFNDMAASLVGWEDTISKKLKGASGKAAQGVSNPFVEEFFRKTKEQAPLSE